MLIRISYAAYINLVRTAEKMSSQIVPKWSEYDLARQADKSPDLLAIQLSVSQQAQPQRDADQFGIQQPRLDLEKGKLGIAKRAC